MCHHTFTAPKTTPNQPRRPNHSKILGHPNRKDLNAARKYYCGPTKRRERPSTGEKALKDARARRAERKGAKILELSGGAKGVCVADMKNARDWQAHSVRGWLSIAGKKHSLKIESAKTGACDRVYQGKK